MEPASLMYLSVTNKMQRYTMIFIAINALHFSGGSCAIHQEFKTVYTPSAICRAFTASYRKRLEAVKAILSTKPDSLCDFGRNPFRTDALHSERYLYK